MFGIDVHGMKNIEVFLRNLKVVSKKLKREVPKAYAERIMKQLKDRIHKQRFQFTALSTKYLNYKRSKGLSTRTFIATGAYVRNIRVRKVGQNWYVTLPRTRHKASKLTFIEIAQILEFGSIHNNIPPRPLWALQAAHAKADFPKFRNEFIRKFHSTNAGFNVGKGQGGRQILRIEA